MKHTIEIAVRFTIPADDKLKLPHYTDTLFIPEAEYKQLSSSQLEAKKMERYNRWKESVLNSVAPASAPEPSVEASNTDQLRATIGGIRQQLEALEQHISSLGK